MCQSNAYLVKNGQEQLVMEDVSLIKPQGDGLLLVGILGETKEIEARIKELQLMDHRILLEE